MKGFKHALTETRIRMKTAHACIPQFAYHKCLVEKFASPQVHLTLGNNARSYAFNILVKSRHIILENVT